MQYLCFPIITLRARSFFSFPACAHTEPQYFFRPFSASLPHITHAPRFFAAVFSCENFTLQFAEQYT
jgi:hypothetical protein